MIIAIIDNKAEDITPQHYLWIHRHIATAIRMFTDIINDPNTQVHQHPADYDLVQLGTLNELNRLTPTYEILMTGRAYITARDQQADGATDIPRTT